MPTSIEQRFYELHPKSAEMHESARSLFPNGVTHDARRQNPFQLYYTHAEGAAKYDVDGNRVLDYFPGTRRAHPGPLPPGGRQRRAGADGQRHSLLRLHRA